MCTHIRLSKRSVIVIYRIEKSNSSFPSISIALFLRGFCVLFLLTDRVPGGPGGPAPPFDFPGAPGGPGEPVELPGAPGGPGDPLDPSEAP